MADDTQAYLSQKDLSQKDLLQKIWQQCSSLIIDLDGVVYRGKHLITGADIAIEQFREAGKQIIFLTNNSASSPLAIWQKLTNLGIACDRQEIFTSGSASASFIADHAIDGGLGVLVFGTEALKQEVQNYGLTLADAIHCGAVLVGLDPQFDYQAIAHAIIALNRGAKFVACNLDANFPTEGGQFLPGCGAIVAAIATAAEKKVDLVIGKPNRIMLDIITEKMQISLEQCLVIGDMLASDILLANRADIPSIWITETKNDLAGDLAGDLTSDLIDNLEIDGMARSLIIRDHKPKPTLTMPSLEAISQFLAISPKT
jgi:HAD superfamily hydrolase (TIGR01450 family)